MLKILGDALGRARLGGPGKEEEEKALGKAGATGGGLVGVLGRAGALLFRPVIKLDVGAGAFRLSLSAGIALVVASFGLLVEAPLLFRVPFSVGVFFLSFVGAGLLLRWLWPAR